MSRALTLLAVVSALASAQQPPGPCPKGGSANYCVCGQGDHDYKWLCRANNGYTWETNDEKPKV